MCLGLSRPFESGRRPSFYLKEICCLVAPSGSVVLYCHCGFPRGKKEGEEREKGAKEERKKGMRGSGVEKKMLSTHKKKFHFLLVVRFPSHRSSWEGRTVTGEGYRKRIKKEGWGFSVKRQCGLFVLFLKRIFVQNSVYSGTFLFLLLLTHVAPSPDLYSPTPSTLYEPVASLSSQLNDGSDDPDGTDPFPLLYLPSSTLPTTTVLADLGDRRAVWDSQSFVSDTYTLSNLLP